jgi:hypothetical protein
MISAMDLDDTASPRLAAYLPRFQTASPPDPEAGDWQAWQSLMADGGEGSDTEETAAMCFLRPSGFGTVSSSLIALPEMGAEDSPRWWFAPGAPSQTAYSLI